VWVAPKDAEDAKEKLWRSSKESAVAQIVADEKIPRRRQSPPQLWEIDIEAAARLTSWRVEMSKCRKKRPRRFLLSLVLSDRAIAVFDELMAANQNVISSR
jgi:hypothetical protein